MLVSIAGVSKHSCYQAGHPQKQMPVAKEFTMLSVRLWLVLTAIVEHLCFSLHKVVKTHHHGSQRVKMK